MRLPEAHTTQTAAAGQCQAKLYIYVYEPYQGELTFVTALIFVPINPLAISLDYIATHTLYRIYFYLWTEQMILIVCLFWLGHAEAEAGAEARQLWTWPSGQWRHRKRQQTRMRCDNDSETQRNELKPKRNGIKTWHAFKNSNKQIFYF